jgi:phospholipid/cholesterol/gamma-HCH transport system substrate-binding protein
MKREVKIGIFGVAMILLAWGGVRFLSGLDVFARNVDYVAVYDQVNGVQEASAVMIKGVKVGTVSAIELDPSTSGQVALHLLIKSAYRIPTDSEARIFSDGLMGGKAIEIVLGNATTMLESGDTIRSSRTRDLMDMAGSELDFVKEKFATIADDLSRTLGNLNQILEANSAHLNQTMKHLDQLSGDVAELMSKEKTHLEEAVDGLASFATMLGENAPKVDSMLSGVTELIATLDREEVAEKLASTIASLNEVLAEVEGGEGTIGRLMSDEQLYKNLTAASENLAVLLADLKEHPARYVHLSVFGKDAEKSQMKAAKKAAKAEKKLAKAAQANDNE